MSPFVVLEGGDGCGKSTQVARLAQRFRAEGREVVVTREPGATPAGASIRAVVLDGEPIDARTEALLIAADRAEHAVRVLRPALERGAVVVSDRYVPSSLAYQGVARGLGVDEIERLSAWATGDLRPDVVVVLDVPAEVAAARRAGPGDRMEREDGRFRDAVRQAYLDLASRYGWVVVDGSRPADEVSEAVWAAVQGAVPAV
ncbi:MAG: dTMP kinase [Acidimicrobiia bacterium]